MEKILANTKERQCAKFFIAFAVVSRFLRDHDYDYDLKDLIEGLKKREEGFYNSYTMNHCLDNLSEHIEILKNN